MKIDLNTTRQVVNTIVDKISFDKFRELLNLHKPAEIFNSEYSTRMPCWYITEYLDENRVMCYANGSASKKPEEYSMEEIYKSWSYQGLRFCYFNVEENITVNKA